VPDAIAILDDLKPVAVDFNLVDPAFALGRCLGGAGINGRTNAGGLDAQATA
jgi:hypothetical protein